MLKSFLAAVLLSASVERVGVSCMRDFPVPFGPIFNFFGVKFFTIFSTLSNFLTVRAPPYGEKFENISKFCF